MPGGKLRRIVVALLLMALLTPASALATHARCQAQQHTCDSPTFEQCCCGHLTGTTAQQANTGQRGWNPAPLAELPSLPLSLHDCRPLAVYAVPAREDLVVIDRLALFKVLLI